MSLLFSASTVCVLYTMKWSSSSLGHTSVTERTLDLPLQTFDLAIGRVSLARENEAGGSWGQEVHILHVNV